MGLTADLSRREATKLADAVSIEVNGEVVAVQGSGLYLSDLLRRVLDEGERSETTTENYRVTADKMLAWFKDDSRIGDISRHRIDGFLTYLKASVGQSTYAKHQRHIRTMMREAVDKGYAPCNPFAHMKIRSSTTDRDWEYVTDAMMSRIMRATSGEMRRLLCLARWAGLRRNECLRLAWADIDWENRRLKVRNPDGVRTTKHRMRIVPIVPQLYDLLEVDYLESDGGELVCDLGLTGGAVSMAAAEAVRRAGLQPWPRILHTLRKNCATDWARRFKIAVVAEWMGHSPEVALRTYAKAEEEDYRAATAQCNQPMLKHSPVT